MPYKANAARRHKTPRACYKITNWPEYNRALLRRGNLTVWVTQGACRRTRPHHVFPAQPRPGTRYGVGARPGTVLEGHCGSGDETNKMGLSIG